MASNIKNKVMENAEAKFARRQFAASEGAKAMAEYHSAAHAMRERTAKLRAARLDREAQGIPAAAAEPKPVKPPRTPRAAKTTAAPARRRKAPRPLSAAE